MRMTGARALTLVVLCLLLIQLTVAATKGKPESSKAKSSKDRMIAQWESAKELAEANTKQMEQQKRDLARDEKLAMRASPKLGAAFSQAMKLFESGQVDQAIPLLEQAAEGGHRSALYQLGALYEYGKYVDRNIEEAVRLYQQSADLGDPQAQRALAFLYDMGRGVPQSSAKALLYYTFAARSLDFEAAMVLGTKFSRGYQTTRNCQAAAAHLRFAAWEVLQDLEAHPIQSSHIDTLSLRKYAEDGDDGSSTREVLRDLHEFNVDSDRPETMVEVGVMYLYGTFGLEPDYNVARNYFEQVDIETVPRAASYLGVMYQYGLGVPVNLEKAHTLYKFAADRENIQGMLFLGDLYLHGEGVETDYEKAREQFEALKKKGVAEGFTRMALMYYDGLGMPQDFEQAAVHSKTAAMSSSHRSIIRAKYLRAEMLHYGIGMNANCEGALIQYRSIIDKGNWRHRLESAASLFVEEGEGLSAVVEYEKLAEMGDLTAQSNVAWLYDEYLQKGEGAIPSTFGSARSLATRFYQRAADQGDQVAHVRLGDFYYYGTPDISVDHTKAASYYTRVMEIDARACFNVAYMYQYGEGVAKDLHLAKRHYDAALNMEKRSFLAVYLCLLPLGLEYSMNLVADGQVDRLIEEYIDYFVPVVFFEFYQQLKTDFFATVPEEQPTTPAKEPRTASRAGKKSPGKGEATASFLDQESIFGCQWDTVFIVAIGSILLLAVLLRTGLLRVEVIV